jgi:hypothetical protein
MTAYTRQAWTGPPREIAEFKAALETRLRQTGVGFWVIPEFGQPPAVAPENPLESTFVAALPDDLAMPAKPAPVSKDSAEMAVEREGLLPARLIADARSRIEAIEAETRA